MIATTGKIVRAFWGKSFDEIKKELEESIKKAVEPCYKHNGNGSSNTPANDPGNNNDSGSDSKVSFNAETHSADAFAQTQTPEADLSTVAMSDENYLSSIDSAENDPFCQDLTGCDFGYTA